MNSGNRPLSPHLQVYKPQITSVLSILHRITGIGLASGAIAVVLWLGAVAYGEIYYSIAKSILAHWLGQIFLFGWLWALFYHLSNGVRHMIWDFGIGLEMHQVRISGWIVIWVSIVGVIAFWFFGNIL